jgi:hypothetical protein
MTSSVAIDLKGRPLSVPLAAHHRARFSAFPLPEFE